MAATRLMIATTAPTVPKVIESVSAVEISLGLKRLYVDDVIKGAWVDGTNVVEKVSVVFYEV
jgi:hypothetical protein